VQLVFLDIQMPRISGIEFLRSLAHPPAVIFTTAFPEFALEGFELQAIDYLVKPISFDRFLKAALRAREFIEIRQKNAGPGPREDYFFIKADNRLVRINFDDVLFVEALQNYVSIHCTAGKYMTYLTFRAIEEYLPPDRFLRIHKSFIVAAGRIDQIEGNEIRIGSHHLPISRNLKDAVMEKLLKGRFPRR
jgi:DNA-binding LytR/AlgR family response regulator